MTQPQQIIVVPHTHWDREWYEPHDVFRLRLVHMVDGLLDLLEQEPQYKFTLDGQAAAIDDYLEMRPDQKRRVIDAVERGQLSIGPFLILLDEFSCDGETIIRNLELGIKSSRALGGEMRVGYLPDMFGHAAQMPQILQGFGIDHAVLWRGVPDRVVNHGFKWTALDGSAVRTEYLFDGYGNGLDMFALAGQLPQLAAQYAEETSPYFGSDPVLAMLGTDHSAPPRDLVQRVNEFNESGHQPAMEVATLDQYLATIGSNTDGLPEVVGELRSHARGNLLPGVFSIRTNMKQAMSNAERALTVAERFDTMFPKLGHETFLQTAWYRVVESTAHDSVTGCGVDSTAEQVETRLNTASHIARGVTETALQGAVEKVSASDYLVVNPSSFARKGQVEVVVAQTSNPGEHAQVIEELPQVLGDEQLTTADLTKILRRIHGRELFGQQINSYQWGESSLRFDVAEVPEGIFDLAQLTSEIREVVATQPADKLWHVETIAAPRERILVEVPLDGLGVNLLSQALPTSDPVQVTETGLKNRALSAQVQEDGTLTITTPAGFELTNVLTIVDEGDRGDSYNYGPVDPSSAVDEPTNVAVEVIETGPLRGRIRITRTYEVPVAVDSQDRNLRTNETTSLVVTADIELRAGEEYLRTTIEVTNTAQDHRLRVLVPTGHRNVETSYAAGQYGLTQRGRTAEGGWGEFPLPTYPASRFVAAGKSTVLVDKLTEFEIVTPEDEAGDDQIALTLLRAVGLMSVNVHPLRDEPAGSEIAVPGAQYLGQTVTTKFAILPSPAGWEQAEAVKHSDLFRLEPHIVRGQGDLGSNSVAPEPAVSFETNGAVGVESLRTIHDTGAIEVRVVNYTSQDQPLQATSNHTWYSVNMVGEGSAEVPHLAEEVIRAGEIRTFRSR